MFDSGPAWMRLTKNEGDLLGPPRVTDPQSVSKRHNISRARMLGGETRPVDVFAVATCEGWQEMMQALGTAAAARHQ